MSGKIFKTVFVVWLVLWVVFLAREDKSSQYKTLFDLYRMPRPARAVYLAGKDMGGFLELCLAGMKRGSTYELVGFEEHSIDSVRARYLLWPFHAAEGNTDYKIVLGGAEYTGYQTVKTLGGTKKLLMNKDICR